MYEIKVAEMTCGSCVGSIIPSDLLATWSSLKTVAISCIYKSYFICHKVSPMFVYIDRVHV